MTAANASGVPHSQTSRYLLSIPSPTSRAGAPKVRGRSSEARTKCGRRGDHSQWEMIGRDEEFGIGDVGMKSGERSDKGVANDWRIQLLSVVGIVACMASVALLRPAVGINGFW